MIEKMAYVSIIGPKERFDDITDEYISDYDIHLENAVLHMSGQAHITPFAENDPYKDLLARLSDITDAAAAIHPVPKEKNPKKAAKKAANEEKLLLKKYAGKTMSREEAVSFIETLSSGLEEDLKKRRQLINDREDLLRDLHSIEPYRSLDHKIEDILSFTHISYRFGRFPKTSWNYFKNNVNQNLFSLFKRTKIDNEYIWGVYFVPEGENSRIDSIFAALHFERMEICEDYTGTPDEICRQLEEKIEKIDRELHWTESEIDSTLSGNQDKLWLANDKLKELSHNFDARRMAACIHEEHGDPYSTYFILCGWMRQRDARELSQRLSGKDNYVTVTVDEDADSSAQTPPTSIKNKGIFKPYEMYIRMYGLPAYNEFDPTVIVALLYSFIFGIMFGDLGHGLVLLIGGLILYFIKRSQLAGIIAFAGFFSAIFGVLFGSLFGFENIIPALWMHPKEAMSTLPFIGRLNTIFAITVAFGMILMLFTMILNILNHIKQKDFSGSIFTSNGIAGFIFYGTLTLTVFLFMTGKTLPAAIILLIFIIVPLIMMAFNEPLTNLVRKRKPLEGGVGMFLVEAFFDMFETMLSFFSNTLSFVRIGAFAVSHAAMMEVVLSLTGYAGGGSGSIPGLILGNIVVIGFEGLIVGIQVLRLQYYEIFSKFYKGDGREFRPFFTKRSKFRRSN